MFIRPCYRNKDGKRHAYWALVESYRTERGPRQRVVAYLGRLDEEGRLGVQQAASGESKNRQPCLPFGQESSCEDSHEAQPRWVMVNARAVPPGESSSVTVHELGPYFPAILYLS